MTPVQDCVSFVSISVIYVERGDMVTPDNTHFVASCDVP